MYSYIVITLRVGFLITDDVVVEPDGHGTACERIFLFVQHKTPDVISMVGLMRGKDGTGKQREQNKR
jgi:hypothetical protein